ncbi:MAG: Maf family nucleotide pyrophosphatase [Pseudomonadales bacterium]|jgi:septum formation protein|nr:Maf family nucleotide pyrophosphatase [Pseudomonadales bacterium]
MSSSLLILASASPRREKLLRQLGVNFVSEPQDIIEEKRIDESPEKFVKRMAEEKASSAFGKRKEKDIVVVASDTIVVCDKRVLGKPKDKSDGIKMLLTLSNKTHRVLSAVTVANTLRYKSTVSETSVSFREISEIEAECYWDSGEPEGKAGGYAIQGCGAVFVQSINGSYSGVMGLPLFQTAQLLSEFGIHSWQSASE